MWLRIEHVQGDITLIDEHGEIIPADIVTIKIQNGQKTMIKYESKELGKRFRSFERFFANAGSQPNTRPGTMGR